MIFGSLAELKNGACVNSTQVRSYPLKSDAPLAYTLSGEEFNEILGHFEPQNLALKDNPPPQSLSVGSTYLIEGVRLTL